MPFWRIMVENLTKDKKEIVAKTLLDLNYSATQIAELLDIDRSTVYRYSKKPAKADLQQYATEIKIIFTAKQQQILAKILKRMDQLVGRTFDLKTLISAFKILKDYTGSMYELYKQDEREKKYDGMFRV